MKIAIIGSSQYYQTKMLPDAERLKAQGHEVKMAYMDFEPVLKMADQPELAIVAANRDNIAWAEEVRVYWDGRSMGAWGDICMAFALGKRITIGYLEPLSCAACLKQMAAESHKEG